MATSRPKAFCEIGPGSAKSRNSVENWVGVRPPMVERAKIVMWR